MKHGISASAIATAENRNQLKSLLGIETEDVSCQGESVVDRNQLKSLLGIETGLSIFAALSCAYRNQLKSLLGIETSDRSTVSRNERH